MCASFPDILTREQITAIVGRDRQIEIFKERIRVLQAKDEGSVILVEGDLGSGKTLLCNFCLQVRTCTSSLCLS
jgi:tRNA A37 threonylcarbamoyladenosine biosynthesis protein TsaE